MNYTGELRSEYAKLVTRRWFFRQCGVGLGGIALSALLNPGKAFGASASKLHDPLAPRPPHFKPKAKRVIYLFMAGAPSQLELFDYKPALAKYNGKPLPPEIVKGQKYAFIRPDAALYATEFKFAKHGKCGAWVSEVMPCTRFKYTFKGNRALTRIHFRVAAVDPASPTGQTDWTPWSAGNVS